MNIHHVRTSTSTSNSNIMSSPDFALSPVLGKTTVQLASIECRAISAQLGSDGNQATSHRYLTDELSAIEVTDVVASDPIVSKLIIESAGFNYDHVEQHCRDGKLRNDVQIAGCWIMFSSVM